MILQWLGHACFRVEADGYAIVLDPYADGAVEGLRPLNATANAVLCSHRHGDHGAVQSVALRDTCAPSPFCVTTVEAWHDGEGGAKRGPNTVHVLEANGVRVAHLGDLGHALSPAQIEIIGPVDAVMLPVGGYYTIDAAEAKQVADALGATVVLPMHFRSEAFGPSVLGTLDAFTSLCDAVRTYDSDTIEITKDTPRQVAVLRCR